MEYFILTDIYPIPTFLQIMLCHHCAPFFCARARILFDAKLNIQFYSKQAPIL